MLTSILRITSVDLIAIALVVVGKDSIVEGVDKSEVDRVKVGAKMVKFKS